MQIWINLLRKALQTGDIIPSYIERTASLNEYMRAACMFLGMSIWLKVGYKGF